MEKARRIARAAACGAGVLTAAVLLLPAVLFRVGVWTAGIPCSPILTSSGDIVLTEAEKIEAARLTGSELDVTIGGDAFITQLLRRMSQAEDTGRESVQDVPDRRAGLLRIDLHFKRIIGKGRLAASTLFLYREGEDVLLEQPWQGIYRVDGGLEPWLREQIASALAEGIRE